MRAGAIASNEEIGERLGCVAFEWFIERHLKWYIDVMKTTIDKAGRVVIPAAIRERAGLAAGAVLEVTEDELGIRLERVASGPRLERIGRRLVACPTVAMGDRPAVDIAALIEEERSRWP